MISLDPKRTCVELGKKNMTGDFKRRATTVPNSRIHSTSVRSIDTVAPRPAFETKRYHSRASWLDSFFSLANSARL